MQKLFTQHPEIVGETYFQHMYSASSFGVKMFGGALCCFVHAILPFMFEKKGSEIITDLHERMITNRHRSTEPAPEVAEAKTT